MQRGITSPALRNCKAQDKVRNLVNNVFDLNIDEMSIATTALGLFMSQRRNEDFKASMSALRRIHNLIIVALDRIISGYTKQVLPYIAQAYIITEYQYRRDILGKCLAGLIEELLNGLSARLQEGNQDTKSYARRIRLVIDSALVAARK